ncbi:MAG: hypothetical protein IPM54_22860 [Polyangiaceae bacterium]|nr:hypothetical protein [Polyangiaceae bacterium]
MGKDGAYEKAKRKWKKAELDEMTEKFRQLGVEHPEGWARTQVIEGIPNLSKFIFLKLLWRTIVKEGDSEWIDREIALAEKNPSDPFIGGGLALKSLRAKGATDEELIDVVRNFQMEYLWDIVMLLDFGANNVEDYAPAFAKGTDWVLAQIDEEGNIIDTLTELHELALVLDPTGRSGRIRGWVNE